MLLHLKNKKATTLDRGNLSHRDWLLERIRQAEDRVVEGERLIARQREIIGRIEATGDDASAARKLLATYEARLELRIAERDRLIAELATSRPTG